LSHHCHVSCEQVAARVEAIFSLYRETDPVGRRGGDPQWLGFFQPKQRRTANEQRKLPLFLRSPNGRRPRISANKEMSAADNLPQQQQKQREVP
jgi:hypothetical protein